MKTRLRSMLARPRWPTAREPHPPVGYVLLLAAVATVWAAVALAHLHGTARGWGVLGLLFALAVAYDEITRAGPGQIRTSAGRRRDRSVVWLVAAAVALNAGLVVLLNVALFCYGWLRNGRPAGEAFLRKFGAACATLLGCLVAHLVRQASLDAWSGAPWLLGSALSVAVPVLLFGVTVRALDAIGQFLGGVRGSQLLGGLHDNLDELAVLFLGGLVALAALYEPWLCVLALPPMIAVQRAAQVRELEAAARKDPKTELLNALAWEEITRRELARAHRNHRPASVLILDLDRFKRVNDRFGHLVGDDVLRQVGRCLESGVREFDSVGRFGGEEFVVALPEAGETEALLVAERLRSRVNELRIAAVTGDTGVEPMSVSVGVACSPTDGIEVADLLLAADAALYEAKARGRNCVVLAERGTEQPVHS